MSSSLKLPIRGRNIIIILIIAGIIIGFSSFLELGVQQSEANLAQLPTQDVFENELAAIQGNSLLPISNPSNPESQPVRKIRVIVTAYSSTPDQTDDTPFITAAGTWVRDGIVANNKLPFGTKVRFPELFGDKVFEVEDRMHYRKDSYQFDIWKDAYDKAKEFGVKITYVEVLKD